MQVFTELKATNKFLGQINDQNEKKIKIQEDKIGDQERTIMLQVRTIEARENTISIL